MESILTTTSPRNIATQCKQTNPRMNHPDKLRGGNYFVSAKQDTAPPNNPPNIANEPAVTIINTDPDLNLANRDLDSASVQQNPSILLVKLTKAPS